MLAAFHRCSQDSLSTDTCFSLAPELLPRRNPEKHSSENPQWYSAGVKEECGVTRFKKPQLEPGFHTHFKLRDEGHVNYTSAPRFPGSVKCKPRHKK